MNKFLFTQIQFNKAFNTAVEMLQDCEGLEIRSALKQAATDNGIQEGSPLEAFVKLSEDKLFPKGVNND